MNNLFIKILCFLIIAEIVFPLFSKDFSKYNIKQDINYSAQPVQNQEDCDPLEESYEENVFPARIRILNGNKTDAMELYKRHLKCWDDSAVYHEIAAYFLSKQKVYPAMVALKEAGDYESYEKFENLMIQENKKKGSVYWESAKKQSLSYTEKSQTARLQAYTLFIAGGVITGTGLGLFIHDKAGGNNSLTAQYTLMLGGLSIISGGIARNFASKYSLNAAKEYNHIYLNHGGYAATTPEEYFIYSGADAKTKKMSAKSYRNHGLALMALSAPLLAIAIGGFFESSNYIRNVKYADEDSGDTVSWKKDTDLLLTITAQILTLFPAIISLVGGLRMVSKALEWEKLSTEQSLFTLTGITPIINPVSKTYGLALGFSF